MYTVVFSVLVILLIKGAVLEFPGLSQDTVLAAENTTLWLTFRLTLSGCKPAEFYLIDISRLEGEHFVSQCYIWQSATGCEIKLPSNDAIQTCFCQPETQQYHFRKQLDRQDHTVWAWNVLDKSKDIHVSQRNIKFNKFDDSTRWRWIAIVVPVVTGSAVTLAAIFIIRAQRRNNILSKMRRIENSSLSAQVSTESEGHMASSITRGDDAGNIPQTTLAGAEKLCNVQQQLGQHALREELGSRFMCQGGDIMQVLLVREQLNNPETISLLDPSVSAERQETLVRVTNRQHEDYLTPCIQSYRTLPPLSGGNQNITSLTVYEAGKEVAPALPQAGSQQNVSVATLDIKVHYCEESQYVTIE